MKMCRIKKENRGTIIIKKSFGFEKLEIFKFMNKKKKQKQRKHFDSHLVSSFSNIYNSCKFLTIVECPKSYGNMEQTFIYYLL